MQTTRKLVQALGLLSMVVVVAGVHAADGSSLDRVEVHGSAFRSDVQQTCPAVQADLQEAMYKTITKHQIEGSYPVLFEVRKDDVVEVRTPRAPKEYGFLLRRAVMNMDCRDAASAQTPQRFGFMLDIKLDDGDSRSAAGGQRVAVGIRAIP